MSIKKVLIIILGIILIASSLCIFSKVNPINYNWLKRNIQKDYNEESCDESNLSIENFKYQEDLLYITVKNNNECIWVIKNYTEVRVDFDNESINLNLGEDISIKGKEEYTFKRKLEKEYKDKTINKIVFVE